MTCGHLVLLLACACTRPTAPAPPAPWPLFPKDDAAREALVKERTLRPPEPARDFSPEAVLALAEQQGFHTLPSGERRVYAWIAAQQPKWLLFGTFHDSAAQVDAFRRLVGPGGVPGFTHVALEQLYADGRWQGFAGDQRGHDGLLAAWLDAGTPERFDALAAAHRQADYTAWKYGYESAVLELFGPRTLPCDAPHTRDERLRELHCLLAIRDRVGPESRIAMLWGMTHVTGEGFRRFLPPGERTLSLYAIGARWTSDRQLRARMLVDDLTLVPLGPNEAALLLPDGHVDRVRTEGGPTPVVHASATVPGTLKLGPAEAKLPAELTLPKGEHTYWFHADTGLDVVGSIDVRGETELAFDAARRTTRAVTSP